MSDEIYDWTWENLKILIEGRRQVENALGVFACVGLGILGVVILSRLIEGLGKRSERVGRFAGNRLHQDGNSNGRETRVHQLRLRP